MDNVHPGPIAPDKEALGRLVIAEFEARQQQRRRTARARRWRAVGVFGWGLLPVALGVYGTVRHLEITAADLCVWAGVYLATSAWTSFQPKEEIRQLRADVEELKAILKSRADQP